MDNNYRHISRKLSSKGESLILHSMGFVTGDPTIKIDYPYVFHPGLRVTVNEPGDAKWIYMMLPVNRGSLITGIKIAHHRIGLQSHIMLIRLIEQREPIFATVVHNEAIEDTVPDTYVIGSSCRVVVENSILLKVCMNFASTDDMIELGMVEVSYIPHYTSLLRPKKREVKTEFQKEYSLASLFSSSPSLNLNRPPLMKLFFQKKRKKRVSF
ncbi:MAG TPA: hypothetical protein GXX42_00780 [Petrimonas sp.]|uniref:hypothetical protein n=1 Tax=Petrimonas sp. TaxID=2023866 RepID=UPI0017766A5B|nr:hypothetical protein [Petrimonas sp.]